MGESADVPHPGTRIKAEVIPLGMSVTQAARLMGVGRPALSNLLNGKAALSADMAIRLEKAFSFPREELLEMQAKYDSAQANKKNAPADTKPYVPPFLGIKANHIEQWATHNISSRIRLSVFVRTLVHSTGRALTRVDFPGNDDAERAGWDGVVNAEEGTPWVPAGCSVWELGTNDDIKKKADKDFSKSLDLDQNEREKTTFVFVTPRRWAGKAAWIKTANSKGLWKDVRVYDASDLEQWLEQSIPAQAWFANEAHIPAPDVRSLDKCWMDWANVAVPPLTGTLFGSAVDAAKRIMQTRLTNSSEGPTIIAADSTEEALAFLAQLFGEGGGEELAKYRDLILVFDRPGVVPRLAHGVRTFIPVAYTREVERELAPYAKLMHSIIVYPRNAVNTEPHIVLEPANHETFSKALREMGKDRDEITRLENESGRSLTVLRRRMATVPAVQKPEWASQQETAASLVPFLLVGVWDSEKDTDKRGLCLLAGDKSYDEIEKDFQKIAQLNDSPIWSIGAYRGVISKIDLLYAIAGFVTPSDLKRYFAIARKVLGEDDPALDLEEDQRWAAAIHGKTREFSAVFREGISETLVLLSVHGGHLFKKRLGIDPEDEARRVVRDLLPTPLTTRIVEANSRDLPTYAEAAPNEFLSILERDLKSDKPAVLGLLRPVDTSLLMHNSSRTGLLWALEGLSWSPETLARSALILARLAQVEINDNLTNKPMYSLQSIFRAWMPQTAASHEDRVKLMKTLTERFPDVAWKICLAQFSAQNSTGKYSHKPRWRPDGYGFGEPCATWGPILDFKREMVSMALSWKEYTLATLSDLVERLADLDDTEQSTVWSLIDTWSKEKASDLEKALMRDKIRISTLSRRAAMRAKNKGQLAALTGKAKAVYAKLEPSDVLHKHAWLFRETWVEASADETEHIEKIDFAKREEHIQQLRAAAIREIHDKLGFAGLLSLAGLGNASWQIGWHAAKDVLAEDDLQEFLRLSLQSVLEHREGTTPFKNIIAGALRAVDEEKRERILKALLEHLFDKDKVRLLMMAPFSESTWKLVDALDSGSQTLYWADVVPDRIHHSERENNETVERLLRARRPRAAFSYIQYRMENLDSQLLFRLLSEMAKGGEDRPGEYLLEHYYVEQAFGYLNNVPMLSLDEKAGLEFAFIDFLARPWDRRTGIPNLERYIEVHPELFVQAVVWAYKRDDEGVDPADFQVPPERLKTMAERGHKLLEAMERIPGYNDFGVLEVDRLTKWITTVRKSCRDLARAEIADICLGKLLAHAPAGDDGVWPCEPVRHVMEEIESEPMMQGAKTGVYNLRGAHVRGEGGDQERELADRYRRWAQTLQFSHPFVSAKLLTRLAKTYEREAGREDLEAGIRRRLR